MMIQKIGLGDSDPMGNRKEGHFKTQQKHHMKRDGRFACNRCRKDFKFGDRIHAKTSTGRVKIYHQECWEGLFL